MIIDACGGTCKGPLRDHNEDNIYVDGRYRRPDDGSDKIIPGSRKEAPFVYAVFDGVGGEQLGEAASLTGAETLAAADREGVHEKSEELLLEMHDNIRSAAIRRDVREMGTTAAMLIISGGRAFVSNLGDSRIYRLRGGRLEQLSHDHTKLQDMIDYDLVSKESLGKIDSHNALTQYAGIATDGDILPSPHICSEVIQTGDIFLLCSDGLTSAMEDREIEQLISAGRQESAEQIVTELITEAIRNKSKDNISAIIVRCC